jgi:hypothetical protein
LVLLELSDQRHEEVGRHGLAKLVD